MLRGRPDRGLRLAALQQGVETGEASVDAECGKDQYGNRKRRHQVGIAFRRVNACRFYSHKITATTNPSTLRCECKKVSSKMETEQEMKPRDRRRGNRNRAHFTHEIKFESRPSNISTQMTRETGVPCNGLNDSHMKKNAKIKSLCIKKLLTFSVFYSNFYHCKCSNRFQKTA